MNVFKRKGRLEVGDIAPLFIAKTDKNETFRLQEEVGRRRIVLVFYPGDSTPLCTSQLCAFRDAWSELQEQDALVLGINPSRIAKHARFVAQHGFPFPLLHDAKGAIATAYGCHWLFGIPIRTVFVIDIEGKISYAKTGNPPPSEIIEALRRTQAL